jgi:hypothetical protein
MGKTSEYEAKKTYLIKVRVTKEEFDDIQAIAKDKNQTASEVVRNFYRTIRVLFSDKLSFGDLIMKLPEVEAVLRGKSG